MPCIPISTNIVSSTSGVYALSRAMHILEFSESPPKAEDGDIAMEECVAESGFPINIEWSARLTPSAESESAPIRTCFQLASLLHDQRAFFLAVVQHLTSPFYITIDRVSRLLINKSILDWILEISLPCYSTVSSPTRPSRSLCIF